MRREISNVWFLGLWMLLSTVLVVSYPINRNKIPNGCFVPNPCNTSQVWCGVGHESKYGGGPRNPFGRDFFENGHVWNAALCNKDSDGDGLTNGQELGDPNCTWTVGSTPSCSCPPTTCDCGLPLAGLSHPGVCEPLDHPRCILKNTWFNCSVDFNCPALAGPNVTQLDLIAADAVLQPKLTTYVCHFFVLPNDTKYHLIGTVPLIENYDLIHHMTVFGCLDLPAETLPSGSYECSLNPPCLALIGNYERSQPVDCLPPEFGMPIGAGRSFKYAILQIHYNNPTFVSGMTDSSGMKIFLTTDLRPNDGGVVSVGQLQLNIPPGQPNIVQSGVCTPECGGPQQTVFLSRLFLHMHQLGRAANVSQYRNGTLLRRLLINEPFSVYAPKFNYLNPYVEYQLGDELRVECAYDSTSRQCNTYYGEQSTDEMCFVLPTYYPLQPNWDVCVQYNTYSTCSNYFVVPGCDVMAMNAILPSAATCNFIAANPCAVPCLATIVQNIHATGCLTADVLSLMELYLKQKGQNQIVSLINLIWTCGGVSPVAPPTGCLTTVSPTSASVITSATSATSAASATRTTSATALGPVSKHRRKRLRLIRIKKLLKRLRKARKRLLKKKNQPIPLDG